MTLHSKLLYTAVCAVLAYAVLAILATTAVATPVFSIKQIEDFGKSLKKFGEDCKKMNGSIRPYKIGNVVCQRQNWETGVGWTETTKHTKMICPEGITSGEKWCKGCGWDSLYQQHEMAIFAHPEFKRLKALQDAYDTHKQCAAAKTAFASTKTNKEKCGWYKTNSIEAHMCLADKISNALKAAC